MNAVCKTPFFFFFPRPQLNFSECFPKSLSQSPARLKGRKKPGQNRLPRNETLQLCDGEKAKDSVFSS